MINVINMECLKCRSLYFLSDNKSHNVMYECIECEAKLSFASINVFITLKDEFEEELFYKNYKVLNRAELKQYIYEQSKAHQQELERKREEQKHLLEEKQRKLQLEQQKLKNTKIQELKAILESDYLKARSYWNEHSNWIFESEFNQITTNFVIEWFQKSNLEVPDYEQSQAIANVWDNIQVVARAGSGKTRTIINRAIFLIRHCCINPNEILILAFNKKAALEVTDRLKKALEGNIPQAMTFHALAYGIVHPEENLIYDEIERLEKSSTVQQVIDSNLRDPIYNNKIKEIMINYFREDWDYIINRGFNLNPEEMLVYRRSLPLVGLDGKYYKSMGEKRIADFLFEHDIPYYYEKNFWWNKINYRPDFTILKQTQSSKGIVIEFFGMIGDTDYDNETKQKIKFWEDKDDYDFLSLFPQEVSSFANISLKVTSKLREYFPNIRRLSDEEIWHRIKDRAVDEFSVTCRTFIERCRKLMLNPIDIKDMVINNEKDLTELELSFLGVIWKIYEEYLRYLDAYNQEDFDGLLYRAVEEIKQGRSYWLRKGGSGNITRLKYIFIDEFQDFSLLFNELINSIRLLNHSVKLFCVGDDWQAINGFAGSDLKYFSNFKEDIKDSRLYNITTNYRSVRKVVEAGNVLMKNEGTPSKPNSSKDGRLFIAELDKFEPSYQEKSIYNGDIITPALVRLVKIFIGEGHRVTLLSRRKSGIPWYNINEGKNRDFRENLIRNLRGEFPADKRNLIVTADTVHSFKGKEEDVIIILDAINSSFPLLHPRNVFYKILGQTFEKIYSEEKRLFYVALTRAKSKLVIITESMNKSPFLSDILSSSIPELIDINKLEYPIKKVSRYSVIVSNIGRTKGTISIKEELKSSNYSYNPANQTWFKSIGAENFSENNLLSENWVDKSNNIKVEVKDEFFQDVLSFIVMNGVAYSYQM